MLKKIALSFSICLSVIFCHAQKDAADSLAYYDDLFNELDSFLDSIMAPRTMFVINLGATQNYFNYKSKNDYNLEADKKLTLSPSLAYFHKSGLGISAMTSLLRENNSLNSYQASVSGSYDYLKNDKWVAGTALTHFFTKDSLSFYTSPLENEAAIYFMYKDWWFKPSVSAAYGWGSTSSYEEREEYITSLRLRPYGFTRVDTEEKLSDFSVTAAVRHDFYWLNVLGKRNVMRVTPQLSFTSGTQKFGFNQQSNTYRKSALTGNTVLYNSENMYLDDQVYFQPLSLTAFLKTQASFGNFYVQPQAWLDYYFPATEKRLTSAYAINLGYTF